MTSAVIIILREVLEAMLLICTLMASSKAVNLKLKWLPIAIILGIAGALSYALFLDVISEMFEGFGQEIVNSSLLMLVALILAIHNFTVMRLASDNGGRYHEKVLLTAVTAAVAMAMTREGAEIYLYVYAYGILAGEATAVLSGAVIGAGIGLSIGTFVYYGLRMLSPRRCLLICSAFLVVIAAGMASQAALYLSQADILHAQAPLWDTSSFISESSLLGELLHASLGYEASPTLVQLLVCLASVALTVGALLFALVLNKRSEGDA